MCQLQNNQKYDDDDDDDDDDDNDVKENPKTSISVHLIDGPKYTLTASNAAPWWVTVSMLTGQTDGRTDERQILTLDAAGLTKEKKKKERKKEDKQTRKRN